MISQPAADAPVIGGPGSPDLTLAAELRVTLGRATRRIKAERGEAGLSDPQFNVLAILLREGPTSPGRLAEHERIAAPAMTRTVGCLADRGLVRKTEHPTDGRQVVVSLTEEGHAEVVETRRRRDAWLSARLAGLGAADRAVLVQAAEILRRITSS
ncbi:MarR family winged helix-turn-helix transcriptional regulator [Cellulomonas dongxiuzhuiae]|uniref:MarR family transcriptional regulator n=1 Tax=Cellulomonas dongxiuzhuiae TaxID=2819979 RepID=A0ABX8GKU1_9CELL|nr:MarR family transcriptional regulator [Cellulomonas dongxiuzhuiae]MBO3088814.1 MarR family transcriptional regulator [Cellulomonas dongxiuzhuiae]MBO3096372.1 MarR family transcriptional regulator [Cellulomonas dongxiuzhuiae]QWC16784.1 MarR family transcriptional regulator [Cellulomonas dongxiuzhuiae]